MDIVVETNYLTSIHGIMLTYNLLLFSFVGEDDQIGVGSVAGGGRYDGLVGMFDANGKKVSYSNYFLRNTF